MQVQIILCHPHKRSFNHAIANTARKIAEEIGHTVVFHDLYQEDFNPVIPYEEIIGEVEDKLVKKYINDLYQSDILIIVHPNWWGKPPALMSGWIDRVFRDKIAYEFPKGGEGGKPVGLLKLQKVLIFNTANTTHEREKAVFGNPLDLIWKNCVFDFCGVKNILRKVFAVVVDSSPEEREKWLTEVEEIVLHYLK
ncbi:MAG: NAD(P)H-dependent oxidoreductase [Bacteroidota bacterium]